MSAIKRLDFGVTRLVANKSPIYYNTARFFRCLLDKAIITLDSFAKKDYILIYQQGRVGSTSVYETIAKLNLPYRTFHVHLLSPQVADERIRVARENNRKAERYLFVGKYLGQVLQGGKRGHWRILTVYRDPISIALSTQFLNGYDSFRDIDLTRDKEVVANDIMNKIKGIIEGDDPNEWAICKWFDDVFLKELGVDLFQTQIDHDAGYALVEDKDLSILVLKFEDLKKGMRNGCKALFDLGPDQEAELLHSNVHRNDDFAYYLDYVKKNLKVSDEALDRVYSTKFCQHFYSEEDIEGFKRKWGGA